MNSSAYSEDSWNVSSLCADGMDAGRWSVMSHSATCDRLSVRTALKPVS